MVIQEGYVSFSTFFGDKFYTFPIRSLYHTSFSTKVEDKFSFFSTFSFPMFILFNIDNWKVAVFNIRSVEEISTLNLYKAGQKKNKVDKSVNFVDNHLELCKSP